VVLLPDAVPEADVRAIATRLMEAGRQPIEVDGREVLPTLSIGLAVYPDDAENAEALMTVADHTMFHAKRSGRNNVQFYSELSRQGG
jgi:diguanylate cyclase (GGDEF)-like protein